MRNYLLILVSVGCLVSQPSCLSISLDPSLVPEGSFNPLVANGTAFDRATVNVGAARTIVLPHNAVVRRTQAGNTVELFLAKQLGFLGHPAERMTIRAERKNLGCAVKAEDDKLLLATYGEWSCIEGGATVKLVAVVPENFVVEQQAGLSGKTSVVQDTPGQSLPKAKDLSGVYGPVSRAGEWFVVPMVSDPARTAK